jgi:hypothetical protein
LLLVAVAAAVVGMRAAAVLVEFLTKLLVLLVLT